MRSDVADIAEATVLAGALPAQIYRIGELADSRGALLRHTSLFPEDFADPVSAITLAQYNRLLNNFFTLNQHPQMPFVLGRQLAGNELANGPDIRSQVAAPQQALNRVLDSWQSLSPLTSGFLRSTVDADLFVVINSNVAAECDRRVLEMTLSSLNHLLDGLLPGSVFRQFYLPHPQPAHLEQYEVHLSGQLHFDSPFAGVRILQSAAAVDVECWQSDRPATRQPALMKQPLLGELRRYLLCNIRALPTLDQAAAWLGTSSATLKRRLAELNLRYQLLLDQSRSQHATFELLFNHRSVEAVCEEMQFSDLRNFRRSFKRWTGLTPSNLRSCHDCELLPAGADA